MAIVGIVLFALLLLAVPIGIALSPAARSPTSWSTRCSSRP